MSRGWSLLIVSLLLPIRAQAQVTVLQNMNFGTVITGTTTTVSRTSAGAAEFKIRGTLPFLTSGFQLTLPTNLTGPGAPMPITFSATDGVYRLLINSPLTGIVFNPKNFQLLGILGSITDIYVWVGGSVSPPLNQTPGVYTGTIVITAADLL